MIRVPVQASGGGYEVAVGRGLLDRLDEVLPDLPDASRAFVVCDQVVGGLLLARVLDALPLPAVHLSVPVGEEAKTLRTAEALYEHLAIQEAHRADPIVALGGGATGDTAGFVAATYMRGVPLVQIPTTLTAQVDAAVGGKVGVNLPRGKNLVGAFHQPVAVVADVDTLGTLPDAAYASGLGEVAKYALAIDPGLLDLLEGSAGALLARDPDTLASVVAACVRAKATIVGEDEREAGDRAFLNYGHTIGHALERLRGYGAISHGAAVAIGMMFAARLAESLGIAQTDLVGRHRRVLASLGLPHDPPPASATEPLLETMRMDKKYRRGMRFVLLEAPGRPRLVQVSEEDVRSALENAA